MISNSVTTETTSSVNGDSNRGNGLCWTHLAVKPKLSSFSEEEEVEEALKKAASVWLGLLAWPRLMGEDLSYSGVCFPSWGMLLKLLCSGRPLSTVSRTRLRSTRGSGYESWTWRQRGKTLTCHSDKAEQPTVLHCCVECIWQSYLRFFRQRHLWNVEDFWRWHCNRHSYVFWSDCETDTKNFSM